MVRFRSTALPVRAVVIAVLVGAGLLVAPPAQAATFSGTLAQAIDRIATAAEVNTGYDRALFPHWVDADGDCRDTRAEVLAAEATAAVTYTSTGCAVASGSWTSYYDRATWTVPFPAARSAPLVLSSTAARRRSRPPGAST